MAIETQHLPKAYVPADEQDVLKVWPYADLPELPDEPLADPFLVPGRPNQEILFAPTIYDPALAMAEAARMGAWSRHDFIDQAEL